MWTEEDEEKYKDLEIVQIIVQEKSLLRGDFQDKIYLKGKGIEFEKVTILGEKYEMYLPINRNKDENLDKFFLTKEEFEVYEAYECENGRFGIIIEQLTNVQNEINKYLDNYKDYILAKYEDVDMDIIEEISTETLGSALMYGELENEEICAQVYQNSQCKLLIYCHREDFEAIRRLANKIFLAIEGY